MPDGAMLNPTPECLSPPPKASEPGGAVFLRKRRPLHPVLLILGAIWIALLAWGACNGWYAAAYPHPNRYWVIINGEIQFVGWGIAAISGTVALRLRWLLTSPRFQQWEEALPLRERCASQLMTSVLRI